MVFVIAEAGSNWIVNGKQDVDQAIALIDAAADAGADAVKFQVFRAETTYAAGSGECQHLKEKGVKGSIQDIFKVLEVGYELLPIFAYHCKERKIAFMASAFSQKDFEAVDPFVAVHKIASPELHHPVLLQLAAKSCKPVLLSTGITLEDEIEWALSFLDRSLVTLLHCTVQYPTAPESVNLQTIPYMQERFELPVGFSDHSRDPIIAPVAAVALGATVIEKHFTLSNDLVGPDHSWAITATELKEMCSAIRTVEQMQGKRGKEIVPGEQDLRLFSRRSLHTTKEIECGERFVLGENFDILRAGKQRQGIHPRYLPQISGKPSLRALKKGEGIEVGDWRDE